MITTDNNLTDLIWRAAKLRATQVVKEEYRSIVWALEQVQWKPEQGEGAQRPERHWLPAAWCVRSRGSSQGCRVGVWGRGARIKGRVEGSLCKHAASLTRKPLTCDHSNHKLVILTVVFWWKALSSPIGRSQGCCPTNVVHDVIFKEGRLDQTRRSELVHLHWVKALNFNNNYGCKTTFNSFEYYLFVHLSLHLFYQYCWTEPHKTGIILAV